MTTFILIPWATTNWSAQGRLAASTGLPLNEAGLDQVRLYAEDLKTADVAELFTSKNDTAVATAEALAKALHVPNKPLSDLDEPGLGLWEGLTPAELTLRYPKAYKQWRDTPTSICPPEGEDMQTVSHRLRRAIHKLSDKYDNKTVGLILGTLSMAMMRCDLENIELNKLWGKLDEEPMCHRIVYSPEGASIPS